MFKEVRYNLQECIELAKHYWYIHLSNRIYARLQNPRDC